MGKYYSNLRGGEDYFTHHLSIFGGGEGGGGLLNHKLKVQYVVCGGGGVSHYTVYTTECYCHRGDMDRGETEGVALPSQLGAHTTVLRISLHNVSHCAVNHCSVYTIVQRILLCNLFITLCCESLRWVYHCLHWITLCCESLCCVYHCAMYHTALWITVLCISLCNVSHCAVNHCALYITVQCTTLCCESLDCV